MCIIGQDTLHKHVGTHAMCTHWEPRCVYSMQTCTHTHKEHIKVKYTCSSSSSDIHTCTQAIHICFTAHHPPSSLCFGYVCMYVCVHSFVCIQLCVCVCVPASESLNALMTTVLTQVFWLLPLSIGTLTDMWLVTLGWKTREAHTVTMKRDQEEG